MDASTRLDVSSDVYSDDFSMPAPFLYEEEGIVTLYFRMGCVQSQMQEDAPDQLVLSYTRTMMSFLLFNRSPRHIAMIGLGGGSMAKWCHRHLLYSDITVVEINPHVIALRDRFYIPKDDHRFRILCEDGARYVARTSWAVDVLIVDGFDIDGQPSELCSQRFYDDCFQSLAASGLMLVNLCGFEDRANIARIRRTFKGQVLVVTPEDGGNKIVLACKGEPLWPEGESSGSFLMKIKAFEHKQQLEHFSG
ncbi:MAG: spermine/spermidine synthase domain-containing protein [Acidobacteriaceae bacterium]